MNLFTFWNRQHKDPTWTLKSTDRKSHCCVDCENLQMDVEFRGEGSEGERILTGVKMITCDQIDSKGRAKVNTQGL